MSSGEHASATAPDRYAGPIDEVLADELARTLRAQTEELIHVSTSSGSSQDVRLHVPANPEAEDKETLCDAMDTWREPARKAVECFPPGWLPWCTLCSVEALDELEHPPGVPIQAILGGGDA